MPKVKGYSFNAEIDNSYYLKDIYGNYPYKVRAVEINGLDETTITEIEEFYALSLEGMIYMDLLQLYYEDRLNEDTSQNRGTV